MHPTAMENCQKFYDKYLSFKSGLKIVDFGSHDTNGSLKPIFREFNYIGIDMCEGKNVDIVCNNSKTPFENESLDVIVSSSNFEHDELFWVTFLEMCRIIKIGGYIYINAPSTGSYHGFPGDCWRFYLDSWKALEKWANLNSFNIELKESYIDSSGYWKDSVGIFVKN